MVATIEKTLRDEDEIKRLFALELIENIPLTPWAKTLNELFHGDNVEISRTVLKISAENSNVISDNELLSIDIEGDGFDTLGGLVYQRLGKIPSVGDDISIGNLNVEVKETVGRRVKKLIVKLT